MTVANVILLLGQSNAMSFATNGVAYPGGWSTQSLGGGYAEASWTGTSWAQYVPGSTSYGTQPYWGPEGAIALAKRAVTPQTCTYIYKYAVGGVGLAPNPGGVTWSPYVSGGVYSNFLTDLAAAMAQLVAASLTPVITECYWIGNESDCFSWAAASSLAHDLPAFIAYIWALPHASISTKFIITRTKLTLGSGSTSPAPGLLPYVDIVRSAQMNVCSPWVNTDDLASGNVSAGHYDPSSVITLGSRLFAAAQAI